MNGNTEGEVGESIGDGVLLFMSMSNSPLTRL